MRPATASVLERCLVSMLACAIAGCAIDARDTRIATEFEPGELGDEAMRIVPTEVDDAGARSYGPTGDELLDSLLTGFAPSTLAEDEPDCLAEPELYPDREPSLSIYRGDVRYGKAVWMRGTSGTCEGLQWIRFELDVAVPGPLELRYVTELWEATGVGHSFPEGVPVGIFDAPILRHSRTLCGLLSVPGELPETWPVFGNHGKRTPRDHRITGTMC